MPLRASAVSGSVAVLSGWTRVSPAARRWHIAIAVLALAAIVGLPLLHLRVTDHPDIDRWWTLALLCLGITLGQLARVRARIGATTLELGWGEAGLIVAVALAPTGAVPLVVAIGVALKHVIVRLSGDPRTPARMAYNVGALALAAAAGAVVVAELTQVWGTNSTVVLHDEANVFALVVGALTYTFVAVGLVAAEAHAQDGAGFSRVAMQALRSKLLMLLGNILVGLVIVLIICVDPRWLLGMPPIAWLLHHSYVQHARSDEESRMWRDFSEATKQLHQSDEAALAEVGVRGARRIFGAVWAELHVRRPSDEPGDDCYVIDGSGSYSIFPSVAAADRSCLGNRGFDPTQRPTQPVRQPLTGGDEPVGTLWLGLPIPVRLGQRDLLALAAYADHLTAALRDAATERELRSLSVRTRFDNRHDQLTELPNRRSLLDYGTRPAAEGAVAVVMLDLDHFREVNETLGYSAGDEVLRTVAGRLADQTRPGELAARLSGDEFAVLITDGPQDGAALRTHAMQRAREIVARLSEPVQVAGVHLVVQAAAGVVVSTEADQVALVELLRRADIATFQAKEAHGGPVEYDAAHDPSSTDRLALVAELREALAGGGQLRLMAQPIVDFVDSSVIGVEALIRWRHPRRGGLTPNEFVSVVEQSDLIGPFTTHVVDLALAQAARWAAEGYPTRVSVNVPARCLHDRELPRRIDDLLDRHGVPAGRLMLEVTETIMSAELSVVENVLAELRTQGVQLAVDDFGTGYSSLTLLSRVPVNELKVDKAYIDRLSDSPEAAAIVRTAVVLGKRLGMRVIAEGVETAAQRTKLMELGCTSGQGFLLHPPMEPDEITAVLEAASRREPPEGLARGQIA